MRSCTFQRCLQRTLLAIVLWSSSCSARCCAFIPVYIRSSQLSNPSRYFADRGTWDEVLCTFNADGGPTQFPVCQTYPLCYHLLLIPPVHSHRGVVRSPWYVVKEGTILYGWRVLKVRFFFVCNYWNWGFVVLPANKLVTLRFWPNNFNTWLGSIVGSYIKPLV